MNRTSISRRYDVLLRDEDLDDSDYDLDLVDSVDSVDPAG